MRRPFFSRAGRGVALIVVLWAVALISAAMLGLAAILQRQLGQEIASLQNSRAILVAESGLQMALNPQIQPAIAAEASRAFSSPGRLSPKSPAPPICSISRRLGPAQVRFGIPWIVSMAEGTTDQRQDAGRNGTGQRRDRARGRGRHGRYGPLP